MGSSTEGEAHPLHKLDLNLPAVLLNRLHAVLYFSALITLFCHRSLQLLRSPTRFSSALHLSLLLSDAVLAFMWVTHQAFRWRPVRRRDFPDNLPPAAALPQLDVFICTADPHKEPPLNVVNTALSVMALDYPPEKIAVYVSDDGGSELTLFGCMEAAKFAAHWLPFCLRNGVVDRSPEAFFAAGDGRSPPELKAMYERMKVEIEGAVERCSAPAAGDDGRPFDEFRAEGFTRQNHPTVIRTLLRNGRDRDAAGHQLPALVYVSREKNGARHHHFKAGALNVLLRVSAAMSNAPVILTLDCDMYCHDPGTARRALCYLGGDGETGDCAYVQFPQRYHRLNKNDIYACEHRWLFQINPLGMDGFRGPNYVGTGCFFSRRALSGRWSCVGGQSPADELMAVATCNYEDATAWGQQVGFRYGSLVEDFFTGYRLKCEGWRSAFCHPPRPAFLGDVPINLEEALSQNKRWSIGLLEVAISKYNPLTFGVRNMSLAMGLCYAHYAYWPLYSIPVICYGLLPQLALLTRSPLLFPKASDPWLFLYLYLSMGAYGQDLIDFLTHGGTIPRWWSDQRAWMIRGASSFLFGLIEFSLKSVGISGAGFNLTSKVADEEQSKRYEQGIFEFGAPAPLFVPIATLAAVNLAAFAVGVARALSLGNADEVFAELLLSGFVVVNAWPVYEAAVARSDEGRLPVRTTLLSVLIATALYLLAVVLG